MEQLLSQVRNGLFLRTPVHHQNMGNADQGPCVDWTVQGQLSPGEAEPLPPLQVCPKYHRGFGLRPSPPEWGILRACRFCRQEMSQWSDIPRAFLPPV